MKRKPVRNFWCSLSEFLRSISTHLIQTMLFMCFLLTIAYSYQQFEHIITCTLNHKYITPTYRDFFVELSKFGRLEALHVCDNLGDHMVGHVYAKFSDEEEAADALNIMNGRYYLGRRLEVEYSPVTDFREARCRDFDEDTCRRGGFCNFMHIKPVPMCLIRDMEEDAEDERRREEMERRERKRRDRDRRERRREHGDGGDRKRRSRSRSRSRS